MVVGGIAENTVLRSCDEQATMFEVVLVQTLAIAYSVSHVYSARCFLYRHPQNLPSQPEAESGQGLPEQAVVGGQKHADATCISWR